MTFENYPYRGHTWNKTRTRHFLNWNQFMVFKFDFCIFLDWQSRSLNEKFFSRNHFSNFFSLMNSNEMFLTFFLVFNILFENRQFLCRSGVRKKTISDARPTIWLIMSWWCRDVDQWRYSGQRKYETTGDDLGWPWPWMTFRIFKLGFRCSFAILNGATLKNKIGLSQFDGHIRALRTLTV